MRTKEERKRIAECFRQLNEELQTTSLQLCRTSGLPEVKALRCDGEDRSAGSLSKRDIEKICRTFSIPLFRFFEED